MSPLDIPDTPEARLWQKVMFAQVAYHEALIAEVRGMEKETEGVEDPRTFFATKGYNEALLDVVNLLHVEPEALMNKIKAAE